MSPAGIWKQSEVPPADLEADAFRALFEKAPDLMLLADDERCYVDANPAACAFFGLERSAIVGRMVDDFTPSVSREVAATGWAAFIAAGRASGDYLLETTVGTRCVEFNAVADVLPGLHLSVLRDVTEQRAAEDERQLFVDISEAIDVGLHVWEFDRPGDPLGMRLVHANRAAADATGIPSAEILGQTMAEAFPALVGTPIPQVYADVALGGVERSLGDVVYGDERMAERVFSVRAFPLPNERAGVAFNDVTGERQAEARALSTLESMSDAFFTLDRDWRFTYLNLQSEAILDRRREDLLGKVLWDEFPEASDSRFSEAYHRAVREQVPVTFEESYEPLDACFSVRASPTPDGLAVYFQDITERRALEAQLLQAQKLEVVGQLAGGLAHDFNNLLTVIQGYTSVAQSNAPPGSTTLESALGEIGNASARAAALTAKLLAFSRKQMLQPTIVRLDDIVAAALDLAGPLIGEQIVVHRLLDARAGNVLVDVGQIEQVIMNLVVNARDAIGGSGNLVVETADIEIDEPMIAGLQPGGYVRLAIRDDGCGMSAKTLERVFEPFFTTKPAGEGSGLGLSTAFGTISQSGGNLAVESIPGEGTTFTVHLPRCDVPVVASDVAASAPERAALGRGERVLVVEDEDLVRRLTVEILRSLDYKVFEARNPQEALVLCAATSFDVMVTDVVMPGGDGSTLAREVVQRDPELRVLFTSGYTPSTIPGLELDGTTTAFLPKPFSAAELAGHVRDLLDRSDG